MPSPGDLPNSGIKPKSPSLRADSLPLNHQTKEAQLCKAANYKEISDKPNLKDIKKNDSFVSFQTVKSMSRSQGETWEIFQIEGDKKIQYNT